MDALVCLQGAALWESSATLRANEGLLPSMGAHVYLQVAVL